MKKPLTLLLCLFLSSQWAAAQTPKQELRIAFGSCNRHDLPQPLWDDIARDQPNIWIWLGDNIYGDSDDPAVLRAKYDAEFNQPGYRHLREQGVKIIGTWDDHDYGRNDGDKNYPFKAQNQQLALDFLQEPADSPRRKQEGIYAAYTYQVGRKKVKVLLLDDRSFQDTLYRDAQQVYHPNLTGDILGEAQWHWLEQQLQHSDADAHIIASGIQFLPQEHRFEKWANFPVARQRLLQLLASSQAKGVLLISGDRHVGEISKMMVPGVAYPVYEVTSSGLTHPATHNTGEPNQYRLGPLVNEKHYALFRFRQRRRKLLVSASLRGDDGQVFFTQEIELPQ
ncbi:alkaline phosphatase family protein [Hymenobacter taeanensis]|uniref:Alkaline phosphatase family protein n=1 Tax=Hymenobacter taeanensis TaxID=2735321 RepID=A0A6M6BEJ5_9BACT|nr:MULTISPECIES: alkaline phosphatase D family protein [Hymenobacter]QJX45633.1 alkaline phosphatase family protein [Hymenobacter taeanensis]UOQ79469.1 alkaline phosphatase family protein [Hymenobacter sp. 5414T-23]